MKGFPVNLAVLALAAATTAASAQPPAGGTADAASVPITTSSAPARQAYLQGRDLLERLRATDAHAAFAKAAELDPGFALAWYGLANSAATPAEFFAALRKAVALAARAGEGEAHMIGALAAQTDGEPKRALDDLTALVGAYPSDPRAHNLLGNYHFGRQDYEAAIAQYREATALDPTFSQPYNQLGYALRFLGRYDEAEQAFKKYVELIPDDPNPYDSYAELLMKRGRFEDSITQYRKALAVNPDFASSYVGIANDQIFLGKGREARETLARLGNVARNDGERRLAHFWAAVSWVHERNAPAAIAELEQMRAIAMKTHDRAAMAGDLNLMGAVLLESAQPDEALARYDEGLGVLDGSDATTAVKETARRNHLANVARVELARGNVAAAAAAAERYRGQVGAKAIPFEVRQAHEVAGLVAAARGDRATAVRELEQANRQDPRVLFELGEAYAAAGRAEDARRTLTAAADFDGLAFNYAFVRARAQAKAKR